MDKLPDFNPMLIKKAKDGYEDDALQVLENIIYEMKNGGLENPNLKEHLLDCLERTI